MIFFPSNSLTIPPVNQGWDQIAIGFSLNEARISFYLTLVLFFSINAAGFFALGFNFFSDFEWAVLNLGPIVSVVLCLSVLVLYFIVHEAIHMLAFPNYGQDDRTKIGFKLFAVFVLFNGEISRAHLMRSIIAPATWLLPLVLLVAFIYPGSLSANLVGLHLSACSLDLLLYYKLAKRSDITYIWTTGTTTWMK